MTMHKINQVRNMDSTHLSNEELEAAISGLSKEDVLRLKAIAEKYTGSHDMDAEDLLHEAVVRALSGERKTCPRNLPVVNFLIGVIRSITDSERKKKARQGSTCDIDDCQLHDPGGNVEDEVLEKQLYKELERFFEEDDEILLMIFHLQDEHSPPEIQENEGWSAKQYNTIRRRMRRKWNAHKEEEPKS